MENNHWTDINPLWHLVDPLTVEQAAALIAGFDPNTVDPSGDYFKSQETGVTCSDGISWVKTAFDALANAVNAGRLKATIRRTSWVRGWDEDPGEGENIRHSVQITNSDASEAWEEDMSLDYIKTRGVIYRVDPDWSRTTIDKEDLCAWLESKNFHCDFFFPVVKSGKPSYLDPKHPRYVEELAAAVSAWLAMEDENLLRGKTPKQAMTSWVESRYKELGLFHEKDEPKNGTKKGDVNKSAIERVVAFANWKGGGPPKTPGS